MSANTQAKAGLVRVSVFKIPAGYSAPRKETRYYAACDCGWMSKETISAEYAFDCGALHLPECNGAP